VWEFAIPPSEFDRAESRAVRASGTRIVFADGNEALCGTSGLWNVHLGYGNEAIAAAVAKSLRECSYLTLLRYGHEPASEAAAALLEQAGASWFGGVAFSTSGSAANEIVMKIARQHWTLSGEPQRRLLAALWPSYHGVTLASAALSGWEMEQDLYGADRSLFRHVALNDLESLRAVAEREGERLAAIVVEPVIGSGAKVVSREFIAELYRLRDVHGFLVVADEVATGFGRTGTFFAYERWPAPPDLAVVSKGLTNGTCAAAAVLVSHAICDVFEEHDAALVHGETQAGTPPTCAAILATLAEMRRLDALERGRAVAALLERHVSELVDEHPLVTGADGIGCFRALRVAHRDGDPFSMLDVRRAVRKIRRAGAVVHPGPNCLQLIPALVYEDDDVALLVERVRVGLDSLLPERGR
jgi:adenosylmethionine-8-amino-7-oxononanoate aminotransferase